MLRHCCCCCAIVVVFSLFLAFLKFNSIDAGCGGSKEAVNKRGGWYNYCLQWRGKNVCDGKKLQPCILNNGQCIAATINAAPNLEHSAEWDTLCQNNLQRCALTTIKPCRWHQYTDESWQCVAKLTAEWREYCGGPMVPSNENGCNDHLLKPCIINAATDKCEAKNLKAELDLTPNQTWDTFCENIQPRSCTETGIKPCRWHTYIRGEDACVAKRNREIFVEVTDGVENE